MFLPQSVYMPRLGPTFAHRRNQFQTVGHRSPSIGRHIVDVFPQGTSAVKPKMPEARCNPGADSLGSKRSSRLSRSKRFERFELFERIELHLLTKPIAAEGLCLASLSIPTVESEFKV